MITSASGAAIRDILHVLNRRYPTAQVTIYPSLVQGDGAATNLTRMLQLADQRAECDVLLISRGGGSLEDLWAFNDEKLARAIHQCSIPVVSGVGHEVDFTICDFVADVRAPTPSAAAEIITPDSHDLQEQTKRVQRQLTNVFERTLHNHQQRLDWLSQRLQQLHPGSRIQLQKKQLSALQQRLINAQSRQLSTSKTRINYASTRLLQQSPQTRISRDLDFIQQTQSRLLRQIQGSVSQGKQRMAANAQALHALSPLATLSRGYSVTRKDKTTTPVQSASELSVNDVIETQLHDGRVVSKVETVKS